MKTKVFLVRHGETEWNKLGKFQGSVDINLSEEGVKQAEYVSKRFNGDFDCVYTSPQKRAFHTAEIICEHTRIKPVIAHEMREINYGKWEGLTVKEILKDYPNEFDIWRNDEVEAPICGGDLSMKKASVRARNAIREIVSNHKGQKIIIVAHGGIIRAALVGLFNWSMTMYHKIAIGNTSICELNFDDDLNPIIIKVNDTNHLL